MSNMTPQLREALRHGAKVGGSGILAGAAVGAAVLYGAARAQKAHKRDAETAAMVGALFGGVLGPVVSAKFFL